MASTGRLGRGASSLASVIMGLCAATAMSVLVVGFLSRPVAADDMVWCLNVVVGLPDDLNAENISLSYYPVVSCGEVQDSFLDEGLDYPDSSYHTDATYPVLGLYWWLESYNASAVGLEGAPKTTRGAVDTAVRKKFEEKNTKWTRPAYWQKLQEKRKKEEERKLIDEKYQKLRDRQASKLERPALPTSSTPGSKARSISPPNEKLAKLVSHESASHISNSVGKRDISTATRKREVTQSNSRPVDRTTSVGSKSAVSQFLSTRGSPSDQPTYGASHEMHVVAILGSLSYSDPIYTTMTVEGLDPAGIAPSIDDPGYFTISMSCQEAFVAGGSVSIAYSESRYTDSTTAGPPAVVTFAPRWRCYVPGCPDYCYEHGTCIEETGDCVCNDGWVEPDCGIKIESSIEVCPQEEIPFDYFIPFTIKDVPGAGNKLWYGLTAGGFYVDRRYFMTWSNLIPYEAFPQWNTDYSGKNDSSVYLDPGVYGIQYASDVSDLWLYDSSMYILDWSDCGETDTICGTGYNNTCNNENERGWCDESSGLCTCNYGSFWFDCSRGCAYNNDQPINLTDSEGEIWSDTPPSGLYDDMHFVTDTSCSWLISPINKFEELVIDFPFVGLDKGGRVTLYTSNYSGYPIDLISSINTEAPAPLVLRDKNIYVYFSGSTSSHGFVLHYSTRMIPISNVAIGFIVVAIIFGAVCGSVGAGAAIFFVVRRRKRSLHALRTMPGEKTPLLSKEELAGTAARFAGKELATAGFVMKKTKLDFDIAESDACPVMQQLRDIIKIKNRSNHTAAYSVFLPDAPHLVKITATPGRGLIPSGGVVVVDLALTLQYTTHYDQPIRVEVYAASSLKAARAIWDTPPADREIVGGAFVNVKLEGAVSERIDPEEVMLDPTPLASGGFGSVFRGVYRSQIVAVKILKHQEAFREAEMKDFEEECELMKQLRHPCIVSFVGASHVPGKLCICTELIEKGSLSSLLESDKDLPLALLLKFALNTADAMVFLHQNKILFRDLKCGNLLLVSTALDAPVNCKLTDFGTARNVENPEQMKNYTCGLGTPVYMAPELISTDQYNSKVDVFSFGMCLWEMWTREEPWSGIAVWDIPKKVTVGDRPEIPKDCPEHLTKLIVRCWDQNQNNRPAFTEIFDILTEMTKEEIASFQAAGGTIEAPGSESDSKEEMPVMTDAAGAVEMDSRKKHPKSKRHAHVSRGKRTSVKANPDGEGALLSMGGDDAPVQHSDASGFHHVDLTKKKTTGTKMVLVTPEPSSSAH